MSIDFDKIYREHRGMVYLYCYRCLGNFADAEDVTQQVFINFMRGAHKVEERDGYRPIIVKHCQWAVGTFRKVRANCPATVPLEEAFNIPCSLRLLDDPRYSINPKALVRAIRSLTDEQQRALFLYASGQTYKRIATAMGIGITSVWRQLTEAKVTARRVYTTHTRIHAA